MTLQRAAEIARQRSQEAEDGIFHVVYARDTPGAPAERFIAASSEEAELYIAPIQTYRLGHEC